MPDPGRPSKLTPPLTEQLVQALRLGNSRKHSAIYAGIDEATLRRWMSRGRAEREGPYADLIAAIHDAEAKAQILAMGCISQAIRGGNVGAAQWFLERKAPEHYAPRSRLFDPYHVLELLEDQGLIVDRDKALEALAASEPSISLDESDADMADVEVSDEDRQALMRIVRAAHGERAEAVS